MSDRADATAQYERLSSRELHDLAVRRARHHLDLRFFWHLMEVRPGAQPAAGDVAQMCSQLNDVTDVGRGDVADQLRPFYIDYLTRTR
jgi:hypothetical protein